MCPLKSDVEGRSGQQITNKHEKLSRSLETKQGIGEGDRGHTSDRHTRVSIEADSQTRKRHYEHSLLVVENILICESNYADIVELYNMHHHHYHSMPIIRNQ